MSFLLRYATPFTTGFFLISLISGIALFFHVGTTYFREMHEILSMVLILPFVFHLVKNWRPLISYLKRAPMWIASAISLGVALVFVIPTGEANSGRSGGNPMFAIIGSIENGSVANVAPLFGHTPESLAAAFAEKGFKVDDMNASLKSIAKASGRGEREIISALIAVKR